MSQTRRFTSSPAVRASIPLWIGLYGTSGAGKTYSALRLARGIHSVVGGKIAVADTESGRALHYADEFQFQHYPFDPPFGPLDYLALLEQMKADGVTVAIIDSASHEHEGQGGVLEMHEEETERLAKKWKTTLDKAQMSAWATPKKQRRQLIQSALRMPLHIAWCFRAKEKLDVRPGKPPINKGFMPIAGDELVYEMAMTALLLPGAGGVPTWQSAEIGERQMIKLPHWAREMIRSGPLSEETGAALARWAQGDTAPSAAVSNVARMLEGYGACTDRIGFSALERIRGDIWSSASAAEKRQLKAAADAARDRADSAAEEAEIDRMAAREDDGPPDDVELPTFEEGKGR